MEKPAVVPTLITWIPPCSRRGGQYDTLSKQGESPTVHVLEDMFISAIDAIIAVFFVLQYRTLFFPQLSSVHHSIGQEDV